MNIIDLLDQLSIQEQHIDTLVQNHQFGLEQDTMWYVSFKLNEDDEIDRLKEFYKTKESTNINEENASPDNNNNMLIAKKYNQTNTSGIINE